MPRIVEYILVSLFLAFIVGLLGSFLFLVLVGVGVPLI